MRAVLVTLMMFSLALAGCGDDKEDQPGGESFQTPETDDTHYVITVTTGGFSPRNAKVPDGSTVVWEVDMDGCHIVADDGSFDSARGGGEGGVTYHNGVIPRGGSYTWAAISPGDHTYECAGRSLDGVLRVS